MIRNVAIGVLCAVALLIALFVWLRSDALDCSLREGWRLDAINKDEGAINVLQDVAFWLSRCGDKCDLESAQSALGHRYRVDVEADRQTLDVAIPGGLGVIEIRYVGGKIASVRREPHELGVRQTGARM